MKIAIQGHPTRGKEVIQILESLGGKNITSFIGVPDFWYYIDSDGHIRNDYQIVLINAGFKIYTLEEFEKEFPFKVGDKVIFPVEIGWWSGTITSLTSDFKYQIKTEKHGYLYIESYKLSLYPMKEERNITLTLDKAKEWYNKGGELKEIALQAFTEKELSPLPRSWEEFATNHARRGYYISSDGKPLMCVSSGKFSSPHVCPSKKSAEAHLAMIQLEQLRNCWWNGWEPNWNDDQQTKYCIVHSKGFKIHILYETRRFLSFPTCEMAEEFLECFRDLIEKAGDLI